MPAEIARSKVELFGQLNVVLIMLDDILSAIDLHRLHRISFWDALLVHSARRAGCTLLMSEDLQDGRRFDGVVVRNPFASGARPQSGRVPRPGEPEGDESTGE